MKIIKKCIAVLLYLLVMAWILHFNVALLFDLKQICLVIIGIIILYLPHLNSRVKHLDRELVGQNAMLGSMITSFVLIFAALSKSVGYENIYSEIIEACRPLLYGFCIWIIFAGDDSKNKKGSEKSGRIASEDCRNILLELGLTKRETEVSLLVLKGLTNKEIAQELYISETTVKKHLSNVFAKLEIGARDELWEKVRKE